MPEYLAAGLFVCLSLLHFFSARPLWLDEKFVLENLQTLSPAQIFGPLDHSQAFPRTYLFLIKIFAGSLNDSPLALRLFPLLAMAGAFFVWRKIYREAFGGGRFFLLALAASAGSFAWTYYAAELKPYSLDLLTAGLFTLFFLRQEKFLSRRPTRRGLLLAFLLPLSLLVSYAGIFLFWIVLYNFFAAGKRDPSQTAWAGIYILMSLCALIFIWETDLRHSLANRAIMGYWDSYFVCTQSARCFADTLWEGTRRLAAWPYGPGKFFLRAGSFLIPLFLYGLARETGIFWKDNKGRVLTAGSLAVVLFLELAVFGMLKKYPFTGARITLFFTPFSFYLILTALRGLEKRRVLFYPFLGLYLIYLSAAIAGNFLHYLKFYLS